MPFDSNGVFSRVMNWTSDQQNGIAIECGRHDAEDDNFAEGFNETFCRDGRAAATGDFNLGQHKIQNLASGTATTDAVNKGQMETSLATKANDSSVVHKTGQETINNEKTFTANLTRAHTDITKGTNPSSDMFWGLEFTDKNGPTAVNRLGMLETKLHTNGDVETYMAAYLNTNGSRTQTALKIVYKKDGNKYAIAPASDVIDSIVTTTAIRKTAQSGDNASWAVKFGNGFIIQGGSIESNIYTVTLAIPFTKESYQVSLVQADDSEHNINPTLSDKTVTNFKCGHHGWRVSWIAAGF